MQIKDIDSTVKKLQSKQQDAKDKFEIADLEHYFEFCGFYVNFFDERTHIQKYFSFLRLTMKFISMPLDSFIFIKINKIKSDDFSKTEIPVNYQSLSSSMIVNQDINSLATSNDDIFADINCHIYSDAHPLYMEKQIKCEFEIKVFPFKIDWKPENLHSITIFFAEKNLNTLYQDRIYYYPVKEDIKPRISTINSEIKTNFIKACFKRQLQTSITQCIGIIRIDRISFIFFAPVTGLKLIDASYTGMYMKYVKNSDKTSINGELQNFQVFDLTNYQNELAPEIEPYELIGKYSNKPFMDFDFQRFEEPKYLQNQILNQKAIVVNINNMTIWWIQQPLSRFIDYCSNSLKEIYGNAAISKTREDHINISKYPEFFDIRINYVEMKYILKTYKDSTSAIHVDFSNFQLHNAIYKNSERVLKSSFILENVYCERLYGNMPMVTFTKIINQHDSHIIAKLFDTDIILERIMNYYNLVGALDVHDIHNYLDLSNKMTTHSKMFVSKLHRQDFNDLYELYELNITLLDNRSLIYDLGIMATDMLSVMRGKMFIKVKNSKIC